LLSRFFRLKSLGAGDYHNSKSISEPWKSSASQGSNGLYSITESSLATSGLRT
jgi:hypothetical protein